MTTDNTYRPKVLITGTASGIGRATATRFAKEGFDVCLFDIELKKNEELLEALKADYPGNHLLVQGDFAGEAGIQKAENLIAKNWNSLDVLVNCAGVFKKSNLLEMSVPQWKVVFDLMIDGCLLTTQMAVRLMTAGRIIHITSIHGTRAEKYAGSYSTAKAAMNQFCRAMALELADRNILVNAIAPGFVDTNMAIVDGQNELETKWFKDNYIDNQHLPLRRAAEPEEIAGVAFFLAGADASYITGQVLVVDGGLTITF